MSTIRLRPCRDTGEPIPPPGEFYVADKSSTLGELMGELQAWYGIDDLTPESTFVLELQGMASAKQLQIHPHLLPTGRLKPEQTVGEAFANSPDPATVFVFGGGARDVAKLCLTNEVGISPEIWRSVDWRWVDTRKSYVETRHSFNVYPDTLQNNYKPSYGLHHLYANAPLSTYLPPPPALEIIIFSTRRFDGKG